MATDRDDPLRAFTEDVIGPCCADLARRIGTGAPDPLVSAGRAGYEVRLPSGLKDRQAKSIVVCAEPFDDKAFMVKTSRPDMADQLRQIALVRYESLRDDARRAEEYDRLRGTIDNALEQLHQGLTNR